MSKRLRSPGRNKPCRCKYAASDSASPIGEGAGAGIIGYVFGNDLVSVIRPERCKFVLALELEEATRLVAEPAFGISFQDGRRLSILRLRGIVSSSMPGDVTHGTELSRSSMRSWVRMAGQMTYEGIEFVIRTGLAAELKAQKMSSRPRPAPVRARARGLVTREGWQGETPALSTMSR
jgi:hypothetical protein